MGTVSRKLYTIKILEIANSVWHMTKMILHIETPDNNNTPLKVLKFLKLMKHTNAHYVLIFSLYIAELMALVSTLRSESAVVTTTSGGFNSVSCSHVTLNKIDSKPVTVFEVCFYSVKCLCYRFRLLSMRMILPSTHVKYQPTRASILPPGTRPTPTLHSDTHTLYITISEL